MNSIWIKTICGLLLVAGSINFAQAQDACCVNGCHPPCCQPECGPYKATCCPEWVPEKEDHYCWQVERDFVCIPPVKFPWQSCCDLKCGRIRKIHKLKIYEYECDVCKFKWNLKKFYPCCSSCSDEE